MSAAAFDAVAARYDAVWTATAVGRAQRTLVWRAVDRLFHAGDRVLDLGCGTGEDAAHLASHGVAVHATDVSTEMVRLAARRGGFTTSVMRAEEIAGEPGEYDGAISNFGALNCVEDLAEVASGLAAVVRPGGRVAVCLIGRFCLWEVVYYAARLQFGKALRRVRNRSAMASIGVRVHYRNIGEIRAAFAAQFRCERWMGIGLLIPPSYVAMPEWLVGLFGALDRVLAGWPVLRGLADHRLVVLVRK